MAVYQLLFGAVPDPEPDIDERPRKNLVPPVERTEKVSVRLPRATKSDVEAAAAREGVTPETWIARVLARSIERSGATAH